MRNCPELVQGKTLSELASFLREMAERLTRGDWPNAHAFVDGEKIEINLAGYAELSK
jgi:hypothetical protein